MATITPIIVKAIHPIGFAAQAAVLPATAAVSPVFAAVKAIEAFAPRAEINGNLDFTAKFAKLIP
jgi:hypothetical protein